MKTLVFPEQGAFHIFYDTASGNIMLSAERQGDDGGLEVLFPMKIQRAKEFGRELVQALVDATVNFKPPPQS